MPVDCAKMIREAYTLTNEEAGEIVRGLESLLEARRAEGMTEEALRKIAAEHGKAAQREALVRKHQEQLTAIRRAQFERYISEFEDPAKGFQAFMVGTLDDVKGSQLSIDAIQKSIRAEIFGPMLTELEKGHAGILKRMKEDQFNRNLAREMAAMGESGGGRKTATGDLDAFHAARVFDKYKEILRREANRNGADIAHLPGHIMAQHHDPRLLMKAGFEKWRDAIKPLLDHGKTFGNQAPDPILKRVYENIVNGRISIAIGGTAKFSPANIANRLSDSRFLHFKDADAAFTYNQQFNRKSVVEAIFTRMESMADDIGLMERMGPNPEKFFRDNLERVRSAAANRGKPTGGFKAQLLHAEYRAVSNQDKIPGSPSLAHWAQGFRNWQSMAKLGSATISSFTDFATNAANAHYNGKNLLSAYAEIFSHVGQGRAKGEKQEITRLLGTFGDGVLSAVARRFNAADGPVGGVSKLTNAFFKWNGLDWWTDVMKEAHSMMLSRHMAEQMGRGLDNLDPKLRANLIRYGIGPEEWKALGKLKLRDVEGAKYLTPDAVAELPAFQGQKDLERALRAFYVNESDFAVPTPGARERAIALQGTAPGTVWGEVARFAWQFKMFPLTVFSRVWPRNAPFRRTGRFSFRVRQENIPGAIHIALATTMFGYLSMTTKDMLKGREPRDPFNPKTWLSAMQQGGGAGILGDLVFNDFNQMGRSLPEVSGGPALSLVGDLARVWSSIASGRDPTSKMTRVVADNSPFANLFYTRTAIDYLGVYQIQEWLNPGYLRRMERQIERRNNQKFLVRPSEIIAHGGGFR